MIINRKFNVRRSKWVAGMGVVICTAWLNSHGESPKQPQNLPPLKMSVSALNRTSFVRMEPDAAVELTVSNNAPETLTGLKLECELTDWQGAPLVAVSTNLSDLPGGGKSETYFNLDTSLRPGNYTLKARVQAKDGVFLSGAENISIAIVPRTLPLRMPVIMWGSPELQAAKELGFTHEFGGGYLSVQNVQAGRKFLDKMLKEDFGIVAELHPGYYLSEEMRLKYQRIDRNGKPYQRDNVCGLFPEMQAYCYNAGASIAHMGTSIARAYGHFPALQAAIINSEIRGGTQLCFHDHDYAAYRKATGREIPKEPVSNPAGVDYRNIPDFPANRVAPEDDPILTYYRWFWKNGDGWNILHTETSRGFKSTGRKDLWTWHDPAVRVPSIWGNGGGVDVISQWTYSYPDPIKIGQATDELFAMAEGNPGQQVMKMTQIIWYRSQTAPKPRAGAETGLPRASWESVETNAEFITIAPDHLREAFWSKISRPVRGIMYHGWTSLVPGEKSAYRYTNPETQNVLKELTRDVVRPLGPALLQVPDAKCDVALLESFASQIFAGRGAWGYSGSWEADMHLILQYAQLQPKIIYDETVLRDGLDNYKILVMPYCDVLSTNVFQAIARFQKRGGIIVADEFLCPALTPDILTPSYNRAKDNEKDKRAIQQRAADLRKVLDGFYLRYADSSNPDVIARVRRYAGTDYVFLTNDRREYGDYVGHHRLVMEKGLPAQAEITLNRSGGFIYDLVAGKKTPSRVEDGKMRFKADLGPGGGGIFMVIDRPIGAVQIAVGDQAKPPVSGWRSWLSNTVKIMAGHHVKAGESMPLNVEVKDKAGNVLTGAVVPVEIRITDADGQAAEFSGYYGAKDGTVKINLDIARNEKVGKWKITARELASGKKAEAALQVER